MEAQPCSPLADHVARRLNADELQDIYGMFGLCRARLSWHDTRPKDELDSAHALLVGQKRSAVGAIVACRRAHEQLETKRGCRTSRNLRDKGDSN